MTKDGVLMAIDAKMTFDDNALYRQPRVLALFEPTEEERTEAQAKEKVLVMCIWVARLVAW